MFNNRHRAIEEAIAPLDEAHKAMSAFLEIKGANMIYTKLMFADLSRMRDLLGFALEKAKDEAAEYRKVAGSAL